MNSFIQKILTYISQEGLIFFSKFNDLYSHETLSENTFTLFFNLITSKDTEISRSPFVRNYYTLCCYYLTEHDPKYAKAFYQYFVPSKLNINPTQFSDLTLVYNIIEYEDRYHIFNLEEKTQLGIMLGKFDSMEKEFEMFLLYDYYCSLLHLFRGDTKKSLHSSFTIIQNIGEFSEKNTPSEFTKFIDVKNSVLNARISQSTRDMDINELSVIYSNLLGNMRKIDRKVSLKLGLKLFDFYREKNRFTDCLNVLKETYRLLKCDLMKGNSIEYCPEYMLNLLCKMAYTSLLLNEQNSLITSLKKLQKYINIMSKTQNQDLLNQYNAFMLFYQQSIEYTGSNNKNYQILNAFREKYTELVEVPEEAIVNLYAMNNADPIVAQYHKLVEANKTKLENKLIIPQKLFISCLISLYNFISNLTKSIVYDPNETKRAVYLKQISFYAQLVLNHIDLYHDKMEVLQSDYLKSTLVKIGFSYIMPFYLQNNYQEVLARSFAFEKSIMTYWKENLEAYAPFAYILKIRGDAYLKMGSYAEAKECYLKCETLRKKNGNVNGNEKHLAVIKANLGICYLFLKDKRKGLEYLHQSLDAYNYLNQINNNSNTVYQEKYGIINKIISSLNSN